MIKECSYITNRDFQSLFILSVIDCLAGSPRSVSVLSYMNSELTKNFARSASQILRKTRGERCERKTPL